MKNKHIKGRMVFSKAPINASAYFGDEVMATENVESVVSQIPIFPIGSFKSHHDMPEGFDITSADVQKFIANFEQGIPNGRELPVYKGHDLNSDRPAVGWVKQLLDRGDKGLWGVVEWTREGLDLIRNKAYKYISPEWRFDYVDSRTGEQYEDVLFAPALVNEPYFPMPAITASEKNNNITIINNSMNLEELLKKAVAELTDDEKAFLKENKDKVDMDALSDEQKAVFADAPKEGEPSEEEKAAAEKAKADADAAAAAEKEAADKKAAEDAAAKEAADKAAADEAAAKAAADAEAGKGEGDAAKPEGEPAPAPEGDKVTASRDGKIVSMTASRYAKLTAAEKEIAKSKIVASLDTTIKQASVKDKATDFALTLSEEARGKFLEIMGMVTASVKTERATVKDEEGKPVLSASEELEERMKAHVKEKGGNMSAAMTAISKSDPDLMARVDAERAAK